jgi:hypothetical protein
MIKYHAILTNPKFDKVVAINNTLVSNWATVGLGVPAANTAASRTGVTIGVAA